ncbi:MAG: DUF6702 family protein [Gemmatimonadaceae bacterium]
MRRLLEVVALSLTVLRHDIHSTVSELRITDRGIELQMRVFADDLAASVAAHAGLATPADSSVGLPALDAYVRSRVRVTEAARETVPLTRCGVSRMGDAYVLCYRTSRAAVAGPIGISQTLLTERHADQVNVVRVRWGSLKRTVVLTAKTPSTEFRSDE